jgi:hypothetical protein
MEDLSAAVQPPWGVTQFIQGARNIGQFNAYWPEADLPEWTWLNRQGIDNFKSEWANDLFEQLIVRQHEPLIALTTTPELTHKIQDSWRQIEQIFPMAEKTTKGIVHSDCHPKNLFLMGNRSLEQDEEHYLIAIDWAHVGINVLGLDPARMLASPLRWLELSTEEATPLVTPIFEAYLDGLKASGWAGNEDHLRMTYLTALGCDSLRAFSAILELVDDLKFREMVMNNIGRPIEEAFERWMPMWLFGLNCIDEAVRLSRKL